MVMTIYIHIQCVYSYNHAHIYPIKSDTCQKETYHRFDLLEQLSRKCYIAQMKILPD